MQRSSTNIFLIGPMGAGKTTLGQHLAQIAGLIFYDSDTEIEKKTKTSIADIFATEGEQGFRHHERHIIAALAPLKGIVLATGGGVVESPENITCLRAHGRVVHLNVSWEEQVRRLTEATRVRPLFTDLNTLRTLNARRAHHYAALATLSYDTDHQHPTTLAAQIWEDLKCCTKP